MTNRRHTQNEILTAIDSMEARGWTINEDGTITNAKLPVKRVRCDSRLKNAEPRYATMLPNGRQATIKRGDILAAKFGAGAATEQPDEVEVGLGLSFTPETCPEPARVGCDEAKVGLGLSFAPETCPEPAGRGPCGHCGGFMVHGDGNEHRCLQCGRANTPQRVLTPTESIWFRKG